MNEWDWDSEGNEYVENLLKKLLNELLQKVEDALQETFQYARYFISFNDLTRFILSALEKHVRLSEKSKELIFEELKKIYEKTQEQMELPIKQELTMPDLRAIEYAKELHDFYLGKFFQGDKQLRLDVLKWLSKYYLEEGNPIGKGQKGIQEFLTKFGEYLKQRTENKARQIIDTSINHLRNTARLQAMAKAQVKKYRWDAVGDRLTCPYCRSMDGRIFETKEAIRKLELIETDPQALPQVKPFITTMKLEQLKTTPSSKILTRFPPAHPHCYDEQTELYTNEGWKLFKDLRGDELVLSLNPENANLEWLPIKQIIKYHYKGEMIRFYHRYLDLMVTPQHEMLIYRDGEGFSFETAEWCATQESGYAFLTEKGMLQREHIKVEKVEYDGMVYCVELPRNHTLWVRRNGQTVWCGNCRCRVVAYIEEIEEPYPIVITRAHSATAESEPLFRELEAELKALSPREITERIKAHLASDWRRKSGGQWDEKRKHLLKHIEKHANELNLSHEQYERLPYEVMKNPDKIYIQKMLKGKSVETDYIFVKGRIVVVSSDDWLIIKTCFPLGKKYNDYIEKVEDDIQEGRVVATVRIF